MKRVITIATAGMTALLIALTISVGAQDFNPMEKTYLTFSAPVELPGLRLEAGTYVFRLADTPSRHVVQVLTRDEMEILGQWLFVQAERPNVTGETVITFRETAEGATPAVQYWYYPGEKIGKEFVYPKDQAARIATRTGATVLSTEGEIGAESKVSPIEGQAQAEPAAPAAEPAAPAERASAGIVEGAGLPEQERQPVGTTGQAAGQQESTQAQAELPATASPLALSGLLGLLSLAGAAGIRTYRR